MNLLTVEEWISTVLVKAMGWTFTHSIWQALIALLVAYAMLAVMRRSNAAARYNMLVTVSVLFVCAVAITFIFQLRQSEAEVQFAETHTMLQRMLYGESSATLPAIIESRRILDVVISFFNRNVDLFVAVWFIVFCVKWLRLSLNLNYVNRISRFESAPVTKEWHQLNDRLKNSIGIYRNVELLQSNIVKVPLVSGVFRPLIIVPVGMLSNMPADVVESILLHELAHIKRNDFLVNVVQSAGETVFFFNPFILKLSALIREEREACCDTIAVNATNNKVSYVEALVAFGEYSSTSAPLLAFAGSKNHLLQRAKRILYNQNKKPGFMEKSILLSSVIMLSVITAFTSITNERKPAAPVAGEITAFVTDTVPEKINEDEDVKVNEDVEINENDNDNMNADEPSKAERRKRKKMMRDTEQRMEKKQKEHEKLQQKMNQIQLNINNDVNVNNKMLQKKMIELQTTINLQNQQLQAEQQLQLAQIDKAMRDADMERINRDVEKAMKDIDMQKINRDLEKAMQDVDMEKINREMQAATLSSIDQKKLMEGFTLKPGYMNDDVASILGFLEDHDVAEAKDVKSFTLNKDELTVNGKKQSATIHGQLKDRYIKDSGDHIIYSNSNGRKSITIQRNDPN